MLGGKGKKKQSESGGMFANRPALRLFLPPVLTIVLFTAAIFAVILPTFEENIMDRKREMIRELTQTAWDILEYYQSQETKGTLTRSQAQARAVAQIRRMRYGPDNKDYFWINDLKPRIIMHPYRTDLEGRDVSAFTDPSGKRLFQEVVWLVEKDGKGYLDYMWQWKDDPARIVPKVSFVKEFKPWGWIVGTGIYVEDVAAEISDMTSRLTYVALGILGIISALVMNMVQQNLRSERRRRQAEGQLLRSREMLRQVMDNIPQYIFWKDAEGVYLGCNQAFAHFLGLEDPEDILGKRNQDLPWPKDGRGKLRKLEKQVIDSAEPQLHVREPQASPDGTPWWADASRIPLKDAAGQVVGILCTYEDVTKAKEMEQLIRIQDKMASLGRVAAGIAHEIRNPLSGINMYLSALESQTAGADPNRTREIVPKMQAASAKIEGVIKRVLDFARPVEPKLSWFQVNQVIESAMELSSVTLRKGDITLQTSLAHNLPQVHADAQLLEQVIMNLVTNSVQPLQKQTGEKKIGLTSTLEDDCIVIKVSDNGPGVAPEIRDRIFDPFYTDKKGGSGIGLSISHRIISDHGGRLGVSTSKWGGAEFLVRLPAVIYWGYDSHG